MKTNPVIGERALARAALASVLLMGAVTLRAAPSRAAEIERERAAREVERDRPVVERDADNVRRVEVRREKLKNSDRDFVQKAVRASLEQVEISRVAAERTLNPQIRALAESTAATYGDLREDVARLASAKGVSVPAKETVAEHWTKRDGKDFDVDYLRKMVDDHRDAVKLFEKQALDGDDVDLVAFARKHLPALQEQLFRANDLHRRLK